MNKIYYRNSLMDKEELEAASKYFECVSLLSDIKKGDLVVPRYSLFPFPYDQEREVKNIGASFINSYNQHRYVADLQNYVVDLKDLTPETWDDLTKLPENCSFVLKGETNSKKSLWKTHMFAADKQEAIKVHSRLCEDGLIGDQKIYIRKYIPLVKYFDGINGMPITKEFRFFVAYKKILAGAFYWQNYIDELKVKPDPNDVPATFLNKVTNIVGNKVNFFVMDVAQTLFGDWIVIELNDGSMSGISCIDPNILYFNLSNVLKSINGA